MIVYCHKGLYFFCLTALWDWSERKICFCLYQSDTQFFMLIWNQLIIWFNSPSLESICMQFLWFPCSYIIWQLIIENNHEEFVVKGLLTVVWLLTLWQPQRVSLSDSSEWQWFWLQIISLTHSLTTIFCGTCPWQSYLSFFIGY